MAGAILITGASGFIGSALGARLVAAGERVIGIDVSVPQAAPFAITTQDVRDAEAIIALGRCAGVDRIVHAGGISGRSVQRDDKLAPLAINIMGTAAVFEAAWQLAVQRVVLLVGLRLWAQ